MFGGDHPSSWPVPLSTHEDVSNAAQQQHTFGQSAVFGQASASIFGQASFVSSTFSSLQTAGTGSSLFNAAPSSGGCGAGSDKTLFKCPTSGTHISRSDVSVFGSSAAIDSSSHDVNPHKTELVFSSTHAEPGSRVFTSTSEHPTSSMLFGKSMPDGREPKSLFGKSGSSVPTSSLFGKSAESGSSVPASGLFGKPTESSSSVPTTNLFGKSAESSSSAPASGLFGKPAESGSSVPASSLFGKPAVSGSSVPASGLFGKPSESGSSVPASSLFGKSAESGSSVPASSLFGRPSESGSYVQASSLFGKPAESGSSVPASSLFGKLAESGSSVPASSLFGKPAESASSVPASGLFGKPTESGLSVSASGLFGKPAESASSVQASGLFGKSAESGSSVPTSGLFGKPAESGSFVPTHGLFSKPADSGSFSNTQAVESGKTKDLFGKQRKQDSSESHSRSSPSKGMSHDKKDRHKSSKTLGLVGKSTASVDSADSSSTLRGATDSSELAHQDRSKDSKGTRMRRRSSLEATSDLMAIVCKNVPVSCDKLTLRKHFAKFGTVSRMSFNSSKNTATVHFTTHEAAESARRNGKSVNHGSPPMQIFWGSYNPTHSKGSASESAHEDTVTKSSSESWVRRERAEPWVRRERAEPSSESWRGSSSGMASSSSWRRDDDDDQLTSELESMRGTADVDFIGGAKHDERKTRKRAVTSVVKSETHTDSASSGRTRVKQMATGSDSGSSGRTRVKQMATGPDSGSLGRTRAKQMATEPDSGSSGRTRVKQMATGPDNGSSGRTRVKQMATGPDSGSSGRTRVKQMATEPAKSQSGAAHISLNALTNVVANTMESRLEILDTRAKIMKMAQGGSGKQAQLETAKAIVGTCQDMCPEHERYKRSFQHCLSVYEMVPGTNGPGQTPVVDHARAVKEYSRSSADQDMPLAEELRLPAVLQMTMTYLLTYIADTGGEGKWEDWYDFLWNRTRAIRKDLTQQHLCDETSIRLTEQCTRLHIYCAAHLAHEGLPVFDSKINNENLTKCLQSLKEMYADEARQGRVSPNEAEFRAYIVLMNLNEGDTLREVQQLSADIRQSAELRFALAVHSALNSNNYTRFFRMCRDASLLVACIMHRYFNQVRRRALSTMLRAYTVPGHANQYPLAELVRQLCFEDEAECTDFCTHHGLTISNDQVVLERNAFIQPELSLSHRRSIRLIEAKRTTSVGEVINGGPLPAFELHQPTSSFDENGRFIGGPIAIGNTCDPAQTVVTPSPTVDEAVVVAAEPVTYSNDAINDVTRTLFLEVIGEMSRSLSDELVFSSRLFLDVIQTIVTQTIEMTMQEMLRTVCRETLASENAAAAEMLAQQERLKLEREARRRAEDSATRDRIANDVVESIVEQVTTEQTILVADQHYRQVEAERKERTLERCSVAERDDLLTSCLISEMRQLASEVYASQIELRREVLQQKSTAVRLMLTAGFLHRWHSKLAARRRVKQSMHAFPPIPSLYAYQSTGSSVHLGGHNTNAQPSGDSLQTRQEWLHDRTQLWSCMRRLCYQQAMAPLNVAKCFCQTPAQQQADRVMWKLLVSLPETETGMTDDDDTDGLSTTTDALNTWFRSKFSRGVVTQTPANAKTDLLSLYKSDINRGGVPTPVCICVRAVEGVVSDEDIQLIEDSHELLGTSALVFTVDTPPSDEELSSDFWLEQQLRLATLLQAKPPWPALPLVVVTLTHTPDDDVSDRLAVDNFIAQGLVSAVQCISLGNDLYDQFASTQLSDSVQWLCDRCPPQPRLFAHLIQDFVDDRLNELFFTPVCQNLADRQRQHKLHQNGTVLLELYNCVIEYMAEKVSESGLRQLSWPLPEFCTQHSDMPDPSWNEAARLQHLQTTVLQLRLPRFEVASAAITEQTDDWHEACSQVWAYASTCTQQGTSHADFYSRIGWLLTKARRRFDSACRYELHLDGCQPSVVDMPWTDVVFACVEFRLAQLKQSLLQADDVMMVYGLTDRQNTFQPPSSWLAASINTMCDENTSLNESVMRAGKRRQVELAQTERHKVARLRDRLGPRAGTDAVDLGQLQKSLACEKRKLSEFDEYLQAAVQIDNLGPYSSPQTTITSPPPPPPVRIETKLQGSEQKRTKLQLATRNSAQKDTQCMDSHAHRSNHDCDQTLAEGIAQLTGRIDSQKFADEMFERKLQFLLSKSN